MDSQEWIRPMAIRSPPSQQNQMKLLSVPDLPGPVHAFLQSKKEPSIRADCPDGRLSKIILHVVSSTSVSQMMVPLYKRFLELSRWNCKFFTFFFPPPGTRPSSGFPGTASGGGSHRHDPDRALHKKTPVSRPARTRTFPQGSMSILFP